jgi:hypothetical protein
MISLYLWFYFPFPSRTPVLISKPGKIFTKLKKLIYNEMKIRPQTALFVCSSIWLLLNHHQIHHNIESSILCCIMPKTSHAYRILILARFEPRKHIGVVFSAKTLSICKQSKYVNLTMY